MLLFIKKISNNIQIKLSKVFKKNPPSSLNEKKQNVLIVGAGFSGKLLLRDLLNKKNFNLIGFLDDDELKINTSISGYKVFGTIELLPKMVNKYDVDLILIAIPSATSKELTIIVDLCEKIEIPYKILPGVFELVNYSISSDNLRNISLEDLIGRSEVPIFDPKVDEIIKNKKILITGGGGSIGSELCRQILKFNPKAILIIDNCEFNLYKIHQELVNLYPNKQIEISLISITDELSINYIFDNFKPDIVFHAAAFKHVPLLENQPKLAVMNNIFGTQILANASIMFDVKKFILISTDKAVNPTSIMGTTKRIAELYCHNLGRLVDTEFITVRFGNVLGSTGSVIPLFQKQLEAGGPITVTHPEMKRYFMTIAEASQLILSSMVHGLSGEILVLDMGEPIKISYIAEQLIKLNRKKPYEEIQIKYLGLRPGEKIYEELFYNTEEALKTNHPKIYKAKSAFSNLDDILADLQKLKNETQNNNNFAIIKILKKLVPEYDIENISHNFNHAIED